MRSSEALAPPWDRARNHRAAVRPGPMAYLTLGYDHRLIDGAVADQFMAKVKETLEGWDTAEA